MTKITSLPADPNPTVTDYVPTVDTETGQTKKTLLSTLITLFFSNIPTAKIRNDIFYNPYKFYVYLASAQSSVNGNTKILLDTKTFDTGTNFDVATNHRFVAPVAGFYQFNAALSCSGTPTSFWQASLWKNGVSILSGSNSSSQFSDTSLGALVQLAAGDYVELYLGSGGITALNTGAGAAYFTGSLVSAT